LEIEDGLREAHAACTLGLEEALAAELSDLGYADVKPGRGGVAFRASKRGLVEACLWLRTATRVMELLGRGPADSREGFLRLAAALPWDRWMRVDQTIAVDATIRDSRVSHSGFAALVLKDAICDRFRMLTGRRPSVDTDAPDLPLKLLVVRDEATIWRDWSGESLHKRGWRPVQVKSPLNEAIAAGLLRLSGWDRASVLVDPMCGSGTFLIEAAMWAAEMAPGLQRAFAFEKWPDVDPAMVQRARTSAAARAKSSIPARLFGADRHPGAIALARKGAEAAGVGHMITWAETAVDAFDPPEPPAMVVTNPPWGERLGEADDLIVSWMDLSRWVRKFPGAGVCVLSGDPGLTRHLGLRADRKWPVMTGPIECRWLRYRIDARPPRGGDSEETP